MAAPAPQEQLHSFITTEFGHKLEGRELEMDQDLLAEGIVDSMGVMHLLSFMEDTFSISVEEDEITAEHFRSLRTLTALLSKKGVV